MLKLVVVPLVMLALLVGYIQFEVPVLQYALDHTNDGLVSKIAVARLDSLGAHAIIVRQLESQNSRARLFALRTLGESSDPELYSYIPRLCKDENDEVRHDAIVYAGRLKVKEAIPLVVDYYRKYRKGSSIKDVARTRLAIETLCRIGQPRKDVLAILADNEQNGNVLPFIREAYSTMRSKALLPAYRRFLHKFRNDAHGAAFIHQLAAVGGKGEAGLIAGALSSSNATVRAAAAEALSKISAVESIGALEKALEAEKDPSARAAIGRAIKKLS